jgi:hypothetical protein
LKINKIIFIIINRIDDNYLLFLPSCLVKASKNIKGGKEGEEIKNKKKKEKGKKKRGKKEKEKRKKEKGKEGKKKGSPVERVDAVAGAGGSKVCMS